MRIFLQFHGPDTLQRGKRLSIVSYPARGQAPEIYASGKACPQALQHGDVIDLGNRAFEVMHLPGHSSGSMGLYDARSQQFFSGDVVYDGQLLDDLEDSVITEFLDSMEQLLQLKTNEVCPGHYHSFDRRLTELVKQYIDTRKAPLCPSER